jgi:hypothetical protein
VKNTFASIATPLIDHRIQNGRKKIGFYHRFPFPTFFGKQSSDDKINDFDEMR